MALMRMAMDEPMPPLEDALAFADACELTSDEELHDFADIDIRDAFSPGKDLLMPELLAVHEHSTQPHAFFGSDAALFIDGMSMQELHTVDLGQLTELQGKSTGAGKPFRRTSEPGAGVASTNKFKRSRVKSAGGSEDRARASRRDSQANVRRQRASSSAAKPSSPVNKNAVEEADNGANPPVKKRIRRQREELLYLREKVKVLERSLSSLRLDKASNGDSSTESTDSSPAEDDDSVDSARSAKIIADFERRYKIESSSPNSADTQGSLWEGVANRQYSERERAEQENRHLKDALQRQIQLAKSLEEILQNEPSTDLLSIPQEINSFKLLTNVSSDQSDREVVFKQLENEVDRAFRNFSTEVDEATLAAIRAEVDEVKVERCLQKGLAVKFSAHKQLPYSLQAVSNGMWRFFSFDGPRSDAYYCREHECSTENKLARSFGTKVQTGYATLDFRLRHVIERRAEPGRVVLIWRGVIKPIKFSGAPIHGIRFYERGWMIIEQPEGVDETTMTSSCSLSPLIDQTSAHQDVAIGALSDFVIESFHANALRCKEAAEGLMTEEEIAVTSDMIAL